MFYNSIIAGITSSSVWLLATAMAAPDKTKEGLTRTGKPTRSAKAKASLGVLRRAHFGCATHNSVDRKMEAEKVSAQCGTKVQGGKKNENAKRGFANRLN